MKRRSELFLSHAAIRLLTAFLVCALLLVASETMAGEPTVFQTARPVWPTGRATEMNLVVGFRATFHAQASQSVRLAVACSSVYRAWINGQFLARGPARGPHGFYRVDMLDLTPYLHNGDNLIAIEVAGYNINSYQLLDQPSFLQAEVVAEGGTVLAATSKDGPSFQAAILPDRVQMVQRYSFQRTFSEVYQLTPGWDAWRRQPDAPWKACTLDAAPRKKLLPRRVPLPDFTIRTPIRSVSHGKVVRREQVASLWKDRALVNIGPKLKGFPEDQLAVIPSLDIQYYETQPQPSTPSPYHSDSSIELSAGDYAILDLGTNLTGMLGADITCQHDTRLWMVFDEILTKGHVDFKRLSCVNLISYQLAPGTYSVESLAPYTMRYVKLVCVSGKCAVSGVHLREYKHVATPAAHFVSSDVRLNRLYAAGIETFRQNALDIFMDCPSRERAGWLCDSFFTARVASDLTGETRIEKNFFENFLLPEHFAHLPDGMLPMCYPADHYDGVFIPNWALWFVVQLDEYAARSGDHETVQRLRGKVEALFKYFAKFENSDGLLEKLDGWVFVEWSAANQFVQDVNYPSNMLYAGALDAAARMYDIPKLHAKAESVRNVIRQQAYDGHFFVDNAQRRDGKLVVTRNRTEVCQYFSFFFQVATPDRYPELWHALRDQFGPDRKQTKAFAEVHFANSFIGNMLRMELLSRNGRSQQILDESVAYLMYMADRTGTLWENDGAYASCDHGFASHIVHTLYRDVLGIRELDRARRLVKLRFGDLQLSRCDGALPTADGVIEVRWTRSQDEIKYHIDLPTGYRAEVENLSGKRLVQSQ